MFDRKTYINSILLTISATIISCWGLISNNNILLVAATLMAVSSEVIYNIIKESILNKNFNLLNLLYYTLIIIGIPITVSIFLGYIFELLKKKYSNMNFNIPSPKIKEILNPGLEDGSIHPNNLNTNINISIIISLISAAFLPNAVKNKNHLLNIAISIILAFVTPLTLIGLMIGSNNYTKHSYKLHDFVVPITILCSNIFGISLFIYIGIKFLNYY